MYTALVQFKLRARRFFFVLLLLFGTVLYRICDIGGFRREHYLAYCQKAASTEGTFTPVRGKICDRDGVQLAWSERFFDFYLASDLPQNMTLDEALQLAETVVHRIMLRPIRTEHGFLIKRKIPVKEVVAMQDFLRRYPFFSIRQRIERLQINDPRVRSVLGTVRDGHGVSGLEKKYDSMLAGTPGRYTVLLDRNHRKIPRTLKLQTMPVPGSDLHLVLSLKELTEEVDAQ